MVKSMGSKAARRERAVGFISAKTYQGQGIFKGSSAKSGRGRKRFNEKAQADMRVPKKGVLDDRYFRVGH